MRSKKALAIVLAIAMVFGVVSLASAAVTSGGFADAVESKQANQIAYLKALGIVKGDGDTGNYRPGDTLTRQEFVVIVARMTGMEAAAEFMNSIATSYGDDAEIADWARGAVNLAETNGWVKGYDDGNFHPRAELTVAQALTVLIRVLGHEPEVVGTYPTGYLVKGISLNLNSGVEINANLPITREDMARLTYNSLFATQRERDGDGYKNKNPIMHGSTEKGKVETVGSETIKLVGIVAAFDLAEDIILIGAKNLAATKNLNVRLTLNADDEVYIVEVLSSAALALGAEITKNDTDNSKLEFADGTTVKYVKTGETNETEVTLNGAASTTGALAKGQWADVTKVGDTATVIQAYRWNVSNGSVAKTHTATSDTDKSYITFSSGGNTYRVNLDAATVVLLNGTVANVGDLKANDVVDVAIQGNPATPSFDGAATVQTAILIRATRNTVDGKVVSYSTNTSDSDLDKHTATVTLKLADGSEKDYGVLNKGDGSGDFVFNLAVDAEGAFTLNAAGAIVSFKGKAGATDLDGKYVKLVSIGTQIIGGSPVSVAVVDHNGAQQTLRNTVGVTSADVGKVGLAAVHATNGLTTFTVTGSGPVITDAGRYTVHAVDGTAGALVLKRLSDNSLVATGTDAVFYVQGDVKSTHYTAGAYRAAGDFNVGDKVYLFGSNKVVLSAKDQAWPAPTLVSVTGADGSDELTLTFNEDVGHVSATLNHLQFVVEVDGDAVDVESAEVHTDGDKVVITLDAALADGDKVVVKYVAGSTPLRGVGTLAMVKNFTSAQITIN